MQRFCLVSLAMVVAGRYLQVREEALWLDRRMQGWWGRGRERGQGLLDRGPRESFDYEVGFPSPECEEREGGGGIYNLMLKSLRIRTGSTLSIIST